MRFFMVIVALALFSGPGFAQDDDGKGYLTRLLQDTLSGAGRTVQIEGFEGSLSAQARMAEMTIADDDGVWLTLRDVVLDWNRAALLRGRVEVEALTAAELLIPRLPAAQPSDLPSPEAEPFSLPDLPVSIDLGTLSIGRVDLGAAVLGAPLAISLEGAASLAGGSGEAMLRATRIDDITGRFSVDAGFGADDGVISLALDFAEEAGGLVSTLAGLPGAPALEATVSGTGPLSDFTLDLAVASDGVERLGGQVILREEAADGATIQRYIADISGDITALFAPEYRDFFGSDLALALDARRDADGILDVSTFALDTRMAVLDGAVRLSADNWPLALRLSGQIANPDGETVLLPTSGVETRIGRADISLTFDASDGDALMGEIKIDGFSQPDLQIALLELDLDGALSTEPGALNAADVDVIAAVSGLAGLDPALLEALGSAFTAQTRVGYRSGAPVSLQDLILRAAGMELRGDIAIDGTDSGLNTRFELLVAADDIARFSALAGQDLTGQAEVTLNGEAAPLNGTFDVQVAGTAAGLRTGIAEADALLTGTTTLALSAERDGQGLRVETLSLRNPELTLEADATVATGRAEITYDLSVRDLGRVAAQLPGALRSAGSATQTGDIWTIDTTLDAPRGITASVTGPATGPDVALAFAARVPDLSVFVPDIPGPLSVTGTLTQPGGTYRVAAQAQGGSGLSAQVEGALTGASAPNLRVTGQAPLGLAAPFIAPRTILGTAQFDLALAGSYGLQGVSGRITTAGARLAAPNLRAALEDIAAQIILSGGQAQIDVDANVRGGGSVAVDGSLGLGGALPADITVQLRDVVVADPQLYRTQVAGALSINGPLSGAARISGDLTLGETNVVVPASGLTSLSDIPLIEHVGASAPVRRTQARAGLGPVAEAANGGASGPGLGLDIGITVPGRVFVRGRGLDAELGGALRVTGTTSNPISAGQFELVRGRLNILEQRFDLAEGSIQLQGALTPFLRFVAETETDTATVQVTLEGLADDLAVTFSSNPEKPEDEVLALLLFGRSLSQVSAFQALQLANAVAVLAGRGGSGIIGSLRESFGLDDIDVDTREDGTAEVRVGKYISENAYTDVTVDGTGNTEVSINVDLTPSLTARGSVGASGSSSIGLFFERDY